MGKLQPFVGLTVDGVFGRIARMNKTMLSAMAAACAAAVFAQDPVPAQAPEAAPASDAAPVAARPRRQGPASAQERRQALAERRQERMQRMNAQGRTRRASMSAGIGAEAKPFGRLSDGREAKIWRLRGTGGVIVRRLIVVVAVDGERRAYVIVCADCLDGVARAEQVLEDDRRRSNCVILYKLFPRYTYLGQE